MRIHRKPLIQLLVAFLIGLTGVVGTLLLLLSQRASARPMIQGQASLSISKSQSADHTQVGIQLVYTLTYQNTSTETVTGAVITDTLDPRVIWDTASPTPTGGLPNAPYWFIGTLSDSVSGEIVLTVTVNSPLPNGTVLTNTATIDSNQTEPESAEITATVETPTLELTKSDDPDDYVVAGASLTYTLAYSNTGDATAIGVVITDTLDPNVSYVTATLEPDGGLPDAPFWSIGVITPDELSQIRITVAVTRPLTNGTMLTNTAWLDAVQTTPLSATQETTVHSSPVLTITKVDKDDPVFAGQGVVYTIVITNSGNANATSVAVAEDYDLNVSYVLANPAPDDGTENQWTFATLAVDQSETIEVALLVTNTVPAGTVLTNHVTLDSDQTAPVTITELTSVNVLGNLAISKVGIPDPVQAGDLLAYSIFCNNSGTSAVENVVITETYDSRVTFVSSTNEDQRRPGTDNVWDIGHLDKDEVSNFVVYVRVDQPLESGTILTNIVTIDSDQTFPKSFTETMTVSSTTDLALSVTDHPDPVEPGDPLVYTLAYTNAGNADATQVIVTATLDANVSYVTASLTPTCGADNVWYWEIDEIPGVDGHGGIVIHTSVALPLTNSTKLDFTAQLSDAGGDLLESTAQTTVTSTPVLSLDKSDGVAMVYAGDRLTYALAYTNGGKENAYNITITDTLPSYIAYVGCEIGDGDCQPVPPGEPDEVIFHIPVITAQTSGQARVVVQVNDPLTAGASSVINHARMTHPSLSASIDVQDVDLIGTRPDLTISVDHLPSLFSPGKLMIYTVNYDNVGQHMHAESVVITTTRPPGTILISSDWHSSDGETYTYQVGNLPAGSTGHAITFTVVHPDQPEVSAPEFNTPFTIAGEGGVGWDANSDDNTATVYIGVPDLVVADIRIEPWPLRPDVPVTFTVLLVNQGTGWALNPGVHPGRAGSFVDVFIAPVPSYPFVRYTEKDIWASFPPIAPGADYPLVMTVTRDGSGYPTGPIQFSEQEIQEEIQDFLYVKVDNYEDNPNYHPYDYGLIPEYDEMNNVGTVRVSYRIYLPLALK